MYLSSCRKILATIALSSAMLLPVAGGEVNKESIPSASSSVATPGKQPVHVEQSTKCSIGKKLLWYIPDRCMDLLDCFTFEFGFGANIRLNLLLTQWMPVGAGAGPTVMIGWNGSRTGGVYMLKGANADFLKYRTAAQDQTWIMGNCPNLTDSGKEAPLYSQQYKDPLSFGLEGGCIGNAKFMVHFISVADFLAGIFLIDFQKDDIGSKAE